MIAIGLVSLLMGGAWSIFPIIFGAVLLVFWALAMRGKRDSGASVSTRTLPNDEETGGTHKATGYAHEGQAPGH